MHSLAEYSSAEHACRQLQQDLQLVKYRQENAFAHSASEYGSAEHAGRQLQQDLQRMSKASTVYNTALKDAGVYDGGEGKRGNGE